MVLHEECHVLRLVYGLESTRSRLVRLAWLATEHVLEMGGGRVDEGILLVVEAPGLDLGSLLLLVDDL